MSDYRNSTPLHFGPPAKEWKAEGGPMYPEKFPEFVPCVHCGGNPQVKGLSDQCICCGKDCFNA